MQTDATSDVAGREAQGQKRFFFFRNSNHFCNLSSVRIIFVSKSYLFCVLSNDKLNKCLYMHILRRYIQQQQGH